MTMVNLKKMEKWRLTMPKPSRRVLKKISIRPPLSLILVTFPLIHSI